MVTRRYEFRLYPTEEPIDVSRTNAQGHEIPGPPGQKREGIPYSFEHCSRLATKYLARRGQKREQRGKFGMDGGSVTNSAPPEYLSIEGGRIDECRMVFCPCGRLVPIMRLSIYGSSRRISDILTRGVRSKNPGLGPL